MTGREQDGAVLPSGFDDFYRKTYDRVLTYARFLAGNIADAEQAVTDAYAATAQRSDQVSRYEAAEAFVRMIVRQQLTRTRRRWRGRRSAELHGPVPPPLSDPELSAEVRAVLALFARLSTTQREVLALRCQEYTTEEIARELGMKPSKVRTHLERARRRLRDALGLRPGPAEERTDEFVPAASVRRASGHADPAAGAGDRDQLTDLLLRSEAALGEAFAADTAGMERIRAGIIARLAILARDGR